MVPPAAISGVRRRPLDRPPLLDLGAGRGLRVIGEVGRGPVRIDVGEAAGHVAGTAGRLPDRALRRRLDAGVELFEAVPGDRGLEGVVQQAVGDQPLAVVGRADEGLAPRIGQRIARLGPLASGSKSAPWSAMHSSARLIQASTG